MSAERLPSESIDETLNETNSTHQAKNADAISLLETWSEGDEQEQKETWQFLKRALDEDRLSNRKLFP